MSETTTVETDIKESLEAIRAHKAESKLRSVSSRESFLARVTGKTDQTISEYVDDDSVALEADGSVGKVIIEKSSSALVRMYKLTENGWKGTKVPANSVANCLNAGWRDSCGDCEGYCGPGVNDCPGREKRKYMRCPECKKPIFDTVATGQVSKDTMLREELPLDDANEITNSVFTEASNPQARIKVRLDRHILTYHPISAPMWGVRPQMEAVAARQ